MNSWQTTHGQVNIYADTDVTCSALADEILKLANQAIADHGNFSWALSGGSTPKSLYLLMAKEPYKSKFPWTKTHLFWGDERCVGHDSSDSNYKMVNESLIQHVNIPVENIHATSGQEGDSQAAADLYESHIQEFFKLKKGNLPLFDLILLGLGPEGHTASMFPGSVALTDKEHIVMAVFVEKLNSWRLTLTLRAINCAHNVIFLVAGTAKADIISQIIEREKPSQSCLPAQQIAPSNLQWFIDQAAAAQLSVFKQASRT